MTYKEGIVCDGCGAVCRDIDGDWKRTLMFTTVHEYNRISGSTEREYHLCHDECTETDFQDLQDGDVIDVEWAYSEEEDRITGVRWFWWPEDDPSEGSESREMVREEFPDDFEKLAATIERQIYADR